MTYLLKQGASGLKVEKSGCKPHFRSVVMVCWEVLQVSWALWRLGLRDWGSQQVGCLWGQLASSTDAFSALRGLQRLVWSSATSSRGGSCCVAWPVVLGDNFWRLRDGWGKSACFRWWVDWWSVLFCPFGSRWGWNLKAPAGFDAEELWPMCDQAWWWTRWLLVGGFWCAASVHLFPAVENITH